MAARRSDERREDSGSHALGERAAWAAVDTQALAALDSAEIFERAESRRPAVE